MMKRDEDSLSPAERSLLRRFTEVVRVTDLMGLSMVVATACSAYATWRTAQITRSVFAVSERPYVGVAGVRFEHAETAKPRVVVDIRNFGQVQAEDAVIAERLLVDGTELPVRDGAARRMVAGVLSPGVPHPVFLHIPQEVCRSVQEG